MSSKSFADLVSSCTEAAKKMDYAGGGWKPPGNDYTVVVESAKDDVITKDDGSLVARFDVALQILDGEFEGRTFHDVFWINPNLVELTGREGMGFRQACYYATCIAGREIKDAGELTSVLTGSVGEVLNIKIVENESKGNVYKNVRYLNKVESSPETPAT